MKISAILIVFLVGVGAVPCLAELPGLRAVAMEHSTSPAGSPASPPSSPSANSGEVRPGEHRKDIVVTQNGAVRGSLFKQGAVAVTPTGADGEPLPGAPAAPVSFIAVAPAQAHRYHKNDVLTIIVSESSDASSSGTGTNNKTQSFDVALQQFIQLAQASSGFPTIETVATPSKLPEIKFKYDNKTQTDASQKRQDSVTARISGIVIDVKPNGTMVVEATKRIFVDKEEQEFKLSGICRVEDIDINNTVLSTQLANLSLSKQTRGQVHDGLKRGWLNKFIDEWTPF